MTKKQPHQPLQKDEHGEPRFKANAIVTYLLDHGGIDMNKLATLPFSDDDRRQFAQLIGYSLDGFAELSYVTNEALSDAIQSHSLAALREARGAIDVSVIRPTKKAEAHWARIASILDDAINEAKNDV